MKLALPELLSWKFNNQPGMECAMSEETGTWYIIRFPGDIPSADQIAEWEEEYSLSLSSQEKKTEAEQLVEIILADPKAVALLRTEIDSRVQERSLRS